MYLSCNSLNTVQIVEDYPASVWSKASEVACLRFWSGTRLNGRLTERAGAYGSFEPYIRLLSVVQYLSCNFSKSYFIFIISHIGWCAMQPGECDTT